MTLSSKQKKLLHTIAVAFATGALTALQIGLTTGLTEGKALVALLIGAAVAGLSRVAGALLSEIQTTEQRADPQHGADT